ncbi:hypothetical protein BRYFOR_05678 [Marvinbryantia formatexigens DSM 14469]|uniref:Uncharacterized protein n=1 Tax=Marvinbryantia formatexigens DSM 14469 TaxID=478749 RepID=C6LAN6_9FIRM|nr:hypothetical protein BRYFOR_05678 [Marvinbryantia formatexigens DSM 14469]
MRSARRKIIRKEQAWAAARLYTRKQQVQMSAAAHFVSWHSRGLP